MLNYGTYRLAFFAAALSLVMGAEASAQLTPDWDVRHFGVDGFFFSFQVPANIVTDSDGAVYFNGSINRSQFTDMLTVKYAPDGTEVWSVIYDGPSGNRDSGKRIAIDSSGDILVLGRSEGDFLVIKYDASDGSVIWTSQHDGGNSNEGGMALTTDAAGNIYVTGFTRPPDDHQFDFYTYKMDSAGNVLWTATYDGPGPFLFGNDWAVDIALDSNGDVFVTGPSNASNGSPDFATIKYRGTDGAQLWLARLVAPGSGESVALLISPEDDVYVTGSTERGFAPLTTVKYDGTDGSQIWLSVNLEDFAFGQAKGMALDSQGDVYVTGRLDPDGDRGNGNENVVTMRLRAADGVRQWLSIFGEDENNQFDLGLAIAIDAQDNVFVTGRTGSFGARNDLLLLQYDAASGQIVDQGTFDVPTESAQGQALALDSDQNLIVAGTTRADPSGFMDLLTLKYPSQVTGVPGDLDGDGQVGVSDLLILLANWGPCPPKGDCPADLNGDGSVGVADLLILLANWS